MAGCQARSNADCMSSLRSAVALPTTLSFSSWIFSASSALSVLECFLNPCWASWNQGDEDCSWNRNHYRRIFSIPFPRTERRVIGLWDL